MLRVLGVVGPIALTIYCLVDAIQTPDEQVRNLQKVIWIFLIAIAPLVGPVAWLIAGRPRSILPPGGWPGADTGGWPGTSGRSGPPGRGTTGPRGPEDDPDFLGRL